jgi:prolipoprotein diacylglyceryltransferase
LKKAAFLFCTGVIGGFLGYVVFGQEDNKQQISKNSSIAEEKEKAQGIKIGGPWRLIDS